MHLAALFAGEIVNCDSLQLYRGFDIGTAKTPAGERRGIPHHLFDVLDASVTCSAGEYAREARPVIREISRRGRLPMVVGGTGFYLRALLEGLPELPKRDEALRARLAEREKRRPGALHRLLSRLEPAAAARIHARDVRKLVRALEVRMLTGAPMPARESGAPLAGYRVLALGLAPDRARLHEALAARTEAMFARGLLEEVRGLLARGCTGREKPFESLGYKQALAHLRGEIPLAEAIASTMIETRQYAKRQLTWFRRDARIQWLEGFGTEDRVVHDAQALVRRFLIR